MKIYFDRFITDFENMVLTVPKYAPPEPGQITPQKTGDDPLTLRRATISALNFEKPDARGFSTLTGQEKFERFRLALAIASNLEPVELKAEEITIIKNAIAEMYSPLVVGRTWDMLENPVERPIQNVN